MFFEVPLFFVMSISGFYKELDQLKDEVTP